MPILQRGGALWREVELRVSRSRSVAILPSSRSCNVGYRLRSRAEASATLIITLTYFKLKVQELLLFLDMLDLENTKRLNQYVSGQVETIKEIHSLMTSDLKRHYTIEELSKQYLMNTTTLKSVFKAVYGMPIASYMKEYRMKLASNMLLQEDKSISEIAAAVGYKSQSKFTSAFRDIFQILPTAYQKLYRNQ